jgi:hypothetical protein
MTRAIVTAVLDFVLSAPATGLAAAPIAQQAQIRQLAAGIASELAHMPGSSAEDQARSTAAGDIPIRGSGSLSPVVLWGRRQRIPTLLSTN